MISLEADIERGNFTSPQRELAAASFTRSRWPAKAYARVAYPHSKCVQKAAPAALAGCNWERCVGSFTDVTGAASCRCATQSLQGDAARFGGDPESEDIEVPEIPEAGHDHRIGHLYGSAQSDRGGKSGKIRSGAAPRISAMVRTDSGKSRTRTAFGVISPDSCLDSNEPYRRSRCGSLLASTTSPAPPVSDEAKALIAHAADQNAHQSPDLFHGQQSTV